MVRVVDIIPDIRLDIRYAAAENFTGEVIYESAEAYLRRGTAEKLAKVQEELKEQGYSLTIWDAWRPVAAQFALWRACPDARYVADPFNGFSGHCRGNTVDITITTLDGEPLELPSGFDDFSALADRDYSDVSEAAAENARILEDAMTRAGFKGYSAECPSSPPPTPPPSPAAPSPPGSAWRCWTRSEATHSCGGGRNMGMCRSRRS